MKKYLREIELSGIILLVIGIVIAHVWGASYGVWPCAIGILFWCTLMVYKAYHWKEYEAENKRNLVIVLIAILILFIQMINIK